MVRALPHARQHAPLRMPAMVTMPVLTPSVLGAFWFAGSRKVAPDVQIATSQLISLDPEEEATFVVNWDDMHGAAEFCAGA
jgi:hypothetical protein